MRSLPPVHVHVPTQRLRRAKLTLTEAAGIRARWPLPAAGRVLGESTHFPGLAVHGRRGVPHALAPDAAAAPTGHRPRLLLLVLQDLGRHFDPGIDKFRIIK